MLLYALCSVFSSLIDYSLGSAAAFELDLAQKVVFSGFKQLKKYITISIHVIKGIIKWISFFYASVEIS